MPVLRTGALGCCLGRIRSAGNEGGRRCARSERVGAMAEEGGKLEQGARVWR